MPVASELLIRIDAAWKGSDALRRAKSDTDAASTATERAKSGVLELGKAYATIGVAVAAAGVAAKAAFDFAEQGAQLQQLESSFNRMNEEVFKTPDLLNQMRDAAGGTVANLDLMSGLMTLVAGTSKELSADLAQQSPKLLEIAKAATALNPALGDTASLYQDLATGIKRGSTEILDNLGIVVKQGDAQAAYAAQIGKTVEALTGEEKIRALLNATVEKGNILIEQAGGSAASATDSYGSLRTELELLKEEAAKAASEGLTPLVAGMADALRASREFREGIDSEFTQGLELSDSIADLEQMADRMRLLSRVDTAKAAQQMDEIAIAVARASNGAADFESNLALVLGTAGGIRTAGRDWRAFYNEIARTDAIDESRQAMEAHLDSIEENKRAISEAVAVFEQSGVTYTKVAGDARELATAYYLNTDAAKKLGEARLDKIAADAQAKAEADKLAAEAAREHTAAMERQTAEMERLSAASGDYFTAFSGDFDPAAAMYEAADAAGANARALAEVAVQQGILTQQEADLKVAAADRQQAYEAAANVFTQTGDVDAYAAAIERANQAFDNFQGTAAEARNAQQGQFFAEEDPFYRIGESAPAAETAFQNVQTAADSAFGGIQATIDETNTRFETGISTIDSYIAKIAEIPAIIRTLVQVELEVAGQPVGNGGGGISDAVAAAGVQ